MTIKRVTIQPRSGGRIMVGVPKGGIGQRGRLLPKSENRIK